MIRVAIVGTGNISQAHIAGYLQFPNLCKIVALVDIVPQKAAEKAQRYQLDCEVFDDHQQILDRSDIDLIDICTPPYVHAQIAINALNSGKNVLVEKPMAASLEECDQMMNAAKESGKLLSVIAQNRFRTPIANLKKVLDAGLAGPVKHVQVDSFWWRGHCYYDLWWRGLWSKEGGGCTLNHAVHHIDMLGWMMGMPKEITGKQPSIVHEGHAGQIENVLSAIQTGGAPAITGQDGRNTIELITAIYKSGAEKSTVSLPIHWDDPYYSAEGMLKHVPHFYEKSASLAGFGDESITVGSDYGVKK